jgi:hypothetical protein
LKMEPRYHAASRGPAWAARTAQAPAGRAGRSQAALRMVVGDGAVSAFGEASAGCSGWHRLLVVQSAPGGARRVGAAARSCEAVPITCS